MSQPFITPITIGSTAQEFNINSKQEREDGNIFGEIFTQAIQDVKTTEEALNQEQYALATGQTDNPHGVPIAAAKAQLSIDLLVQLRNKALESYNQIINLNI